MTFTNRLKKEWLALTAELKQVKVLFKHFLRRFIQKDNLDLDDRNTEFLVFCVVFVSLWGGYLANNTGTLFFLTTMMTTTAIYCVVNWERLLLDQRDFLNLASLPVRYRTIFFGKFLSLLATIATITASFGFVACLMYSKRIAEYLKMGQYSFHGLFIYGMNGYDVLFFMASFFVVCFLCNLFVFLLIIVLQGLFMVFLRGQWQARASLWLQVMLLTGLASMYIWLPRLYDADTTLQSISPAFSYLFPPLWFNGLLESINGTAHRLNWYYGYVSWMGILGLLLLYALSLPLSIRQFLKPGSDKKRVFVGLLAIPLNLLKKAFNGLFLRNLTERAVFYFFARTIRRSRFHRLKLAMFLALPVGLVLAYLFIQYKDFGLPAFRRVNTYQMAFPFIIYFATVMGLRTVVDHPATLDANWLFKIVNLSDNTHPIRGMKKAMFFFTLLPLALAMFAFYVYAWGLSPAFTHSLYSLVVALLMQELFFFNYQKIPFTAVFNPMVINYKAAWPIFALKFILGYATYLSIGKLLMHSTRANLWFYLLVTLLFAALKWYRHKAKNSGLIFEDIPPATMISLDLYY